MRGGGTDVDGLMPSGGLSRRGAMKDARHELAGCARLRSHLRPTVRLEDLPPFDGLSAPEIRAKFVGWDVDWEDRDDCAPFRCGNWLPMPRPTWRT